MRTTDHSAAKNGSNGNGKPAATNAAAKAPAKPKAVKLTQAIRDGVVKRMYETRTDVRWFGDAVVGAINEPAPGAIQLSMIQSYWPIHIVDLSITRTSVPSEAQAAKDARTMGVQSVVPFGLYHQEGGVIPWDAKRNGLPWKELERFFEMSQRMWHETRSATRFGIATQKLVVFVHPDANGVMHADLCFERVRVTRLNPTGLSDAELPEAASMADVGIAIDKTGLADRGITVHVAGLDDKITLPYEGLVDRRVDFVMIYSCVNSNIQGDPNNENRPRQLANGIGIATRQCVTRKDRDLLERDGDPVRLRRKAVTERDNREHLAALGIDPDAVVEPTPEPEAEAPLAASEE